MVGRAITPPQKAELNVCFRTTLGFLSYLKGHPGAAQTVRTQSEVVTTLDNASAILASSCESTVQPAGARGSYILRALPDFRKIGEGKSPGSSERPQKHQAS